MRFREFRKEKGWSVADCARQLEKAHETVRKWDVRECIPREDEISAIYLWSNGAVRPQDWYDLPALPAEDADADAAPTQVAAA